MFWERIDPHTARTLRDFKKTAVFREFYLSGGTALALQLGHRVSADLDFFTKKNTSKIDTGKLMNMLERHVGLADLSVTYRAVDQLWVELSGVKVTFLAYPFPRQYSLIDVDGVQLADIRDIALQKAFSVGRRAKARDYVDLAWILRSNIMTLEEIARGATEVFKDGPESLFSTRLFLQQLVYTDDLEDKEVVIRQLHSDERIENLLSELEAAVRKMSRENISPSHNPS